VSEGNISLDDSQASDITSQLQIMKANWMESMKPYRSATLWIMYMHMVHIHHGLSFWQLEIQARHQMLPFHAA
jgi:hypothetical protein